LIGEKTDKRDKQSRTFLVENKNSQAYIEDVLLIPDISHTTKGFIVTRAAVSNSSHFSQPC